jgi:cystathionine beta-synthase
MFGEPKIYGVYDNILETIGWTPLVRLHRIEEYFKLDNELYAKLEAFNPGGSIKDRIAVYMLRRAEEEGRVAEGSVVIEPTAGNTGVGLALVSRVKGYQTVFTLPRKMSLEKELLLRSLGALIIRTPTEAPFYSPLSYYSAAHILRKMILKRGRMVDRGELAEIVGELQSIIDRGDEETLRRLLEMDVPEGPYAYVPDQYFNEYNPLAHYETLAREIWRQMGGRLDIFVAGMGTGGTITGVSRYLKEQDGNITVVGVDPEGSIFHIVKKGVSPEEATKYAHPYLVEGIGEDILPETIDLNLVDQVIVVDDEKAFAMARLIARLEGILAGGSSGAALYGAVKYLRDNNISGRRLVVIFPDTGRNYLTKIFNDRWMRENGFNTCEEEVLKGLIRV